MSLVICSNQVADGESERQRNSIYKAWSFRNQLSSTYKIPANAQVALQSVKVNVDGRIVLSRQNNVMYQYFGNKLSLDGISDPSATPKKLQIEDTVYHPLRLQFLKSDEVSNAVKEFSLSDFANRFRERLSETVYHPNLKEKVSVDLLRNASGLDFLGYKIGFSQWVNGSNTNASLAVAEQNFADYDQYSDRNGSGLWTWTPAHNRLQRNASAHIGSVASAILPSAPLSLNGGTLEVNLSGAQANVNTSGKQVPWAVGLSRYIGQTTDGVYTPYYYSDLFDDDMKIDQTAYMDFGCARNKAGQLVVFFTAFDSEPEITRKYELKYWENTNGSFTTDRLELGDGLYEKVKFHAKGEQLQLEIYNAKDDGKGAAIGWQVVCKFMDDTSANKIRQFPPVHQSCWCLHPVLQIGSNASNASGKMNVGHLKTPPLTTYDVKKKNQSGWWETLELLGRTTWCRDVEARKVLQPTNIETCDQGGLNASGFNGSLSNVLIVDPSDIYKPTFGANAKDILGFSSAVIDTPNVGFGTNLPREFQSNTAPNLESSQAMFVRLDGMNQRVLNALTGNRSQIIGHLPRFDSGQSTGRLYFEPKNFVWIDMDNPSEISVSDFNVSFCYSNEQFATILTGQSIVVLYFRKKPKELMD